MSKILVIDDEKSIRNTLKDILEYEKHEVHDAADGMEGLKKAAETRYDIILCDIKMPKSYSLLQFLRKLIKFKH